MIFLQKALMSHHAASSMLQMYKACEVLCAAHPVTFSSQGINGALMMRVSTTKPEVHSAICTNRLKMWISVGRHACIIGQMAATCWQTTYHAQLMQRVEAQRASAVMWRLDNTFFSWSSTRICARMRDTAPRRPPNVVNRTTPHDMPTEQWNGVACEAIRWPPLLGGQHHWICVCHRTMK